VIGVQIKIFEILKILKIFKFFLNGQILSDFDV
jgi:hypothetical protein